MEQSLILGLINKSVTIRMGVNPLTLPSVCAAFISASCLKVTKAIKIDNVELGENPEERIRNDRKTSQPASGKKETHVRGIAVGKGQPQRAGPTRVLLMNMPVVLCRVLGTWQHLSPYMMN